MYCPKCGVHNLEDAKFCRSCGADIHLVPQALDGQASLSTFGAGEVEAQSEKGKKERKVKKPATLEDGLENIFSGIACMVIFMLGLFYLQGLFMVWVWFIIPALSCVGKGIGQVISSRSAQTALPPVEAARVRSALLPAPARELPAADTSEIKSPPHSITESTTRNLGAAPRRPAGRA